MEQKKEKYYKLTDWPLWVSFSCLDAVDRPDDRLPVVNSIVTGKSHNNDGAGAHEGSQAGKEELSILVCIEVTALLWT